MTVVDPCGAVEANVDTPQGYNVFEFDVDRSNHSDGVSLKENAIRGDFEKTPVNPKTP
jgi:hypothetical protein